jgi:hypothetical protein
MSPIFLGTVIVEPGESVAFEIPVDASAAEIAAAIERANLERAAAQAAETAKLRELFLAGDDVKDEPHE